MCHRGVSDDDSLINDPKMPKRLPPATSSFVRCILALTLFATACSNSSNAVFASDLRRNAIVKAVERVRPSVVNIHGHKTVSEIASRKVSDATRKVNGMGTGVIVDPRGYIITNHHVVDGVARIQVTMADQKTVIAKLVAKDPKIDLAIIKIPSEGTLPTIKIGTSRDLMTGESVIAIGNAYGYDHTVTVGIISALHRTVQVSEVQDYQNLIQTDASINPGNSGGPLLNIDGDLIGINVAVRVGAQGIGFALPVDEVMEIASKLLSIRHMESRWHGIQGISRISDQGHEFVVSNVKKDSPAGKSGLKAGDIVKRIGKTDVARALDVERALLGQTAGEEIDVIVRRDGQSFRAQMELASISRRTATDTKDRIWSLLGLRVEPMSTSQFRQLTSRYRGGLRVTAVRPGSPVASQGIHRNDILVGMHVWETVSLENLAYVINRKDLSELQPLKFYILRGRETLYGYLPITEKPPVTARR